MNYKSKLMGLSLILLAAISACTDEMENGLRPANGNVMTFTVNTPGSDGNNTRAADDSAAVSKTYAPIKMQGSLDGKPLYLHTEVTEGIQSDAQPLTRGTQINNTNKDAAMQPFGVMAWIDALYDGAVYINQAEVTRDATSGKWFPTKDYLWPSNKKLAFLAWHPYGAAGLDVDKLVAKGQTSSYVVPTDVAQQVDLMFAKTDAMDAPVLAGTGSSSSIPLTFDHKLAAIKFVVGSDLPGCTITSIKLKNVISKAALTDELAWNLEALKGVDGSYPKADYTLTLNKEVAGTEGDPITAENETFFVIPQTPPTDAEIEVQLTSGGNNYTVSSGPLTSPAQWVEGWTFTYKISASEISWTDHLDLVEWPTNSETLTYEGGKLNYKLASFSQSADGASKKPLAWKAQFSTDGTSWSDSAPTWLTGFTVSGDGSVDATAMSEVTVGAQDGVDVNPHTPALRATSPKGSATAPINLAMQSNGKESTANCYVINAPGWYSFPLVYGNAIKDGVTNASAYTSTAPAEQHVLNPFINHTGNGITDPYISNNAGCTPVKAELVWQDAQNLVADIQYNAGENGGTISFQVPQASICQGNAVIAIKDTDDTVLWSWHIWVTDAKVNETIAITNLDNDKFDVMSVNLGYCNGPLMDYAERSCQVKFTAGSKTEVKTIKQVADKIQMLGNNTYYQWGRKDPAQPLDGMHDEGTGKGQTKRWYDNSGVSSIEDPQHKDFGSGKDYIKNAILNPGEWHANDQSCGDGTYKNLWSADCNAYSSGGPKPTNIATKTANDPSPVGFKIPPIKTFTGFAQSSDFVYEMSDVNGIWVESLLEWNFYNNNTKTATITFPATGRRSHGHDNFYAYDAYGMASYCWLAVANDYSKGCTFDAETDKVLYVQLVRGEVQLCTQTSFSREAAMPIRCVKE